MSGHSKWSTIKHKKGAADAKRGQIFSKLIKEITVAARLGGGDETSNPRLRTVLLKARSANMPRDNIERAIKKGTGDLEGVDYIELQYEAYAPGGIGLLIDVLTDNKNRSAAEIRSALNRHGGSLATTGAVSFQFQRRGVIDYPEDINSESLMEAAVESGALDVTEDNRVITEAQDFATVLTSLQQQEFKEDNAELTMLADNLLTLSLEETQKVLRLIDKLEECDDVQNVASNIDIPDDYQLEL